MLLSLNYLVTECGAFFRCFYCEFNIATELQDEPGVVNKVTICKECKSIQRKMKWTQFFKRFMQLPTARRSNQLHEHFYSIPSE